MPHIMKKTKKMMEAIACAVSPFHIDVDRLADGFAVSVHGVSSICEFSDKRVILELSFSRLEINGDMLDLTVYEQGMVQINGKISGMEFSYGKT